MLYKVVLDTNVLVPSVLRDMLLSLAHEDFYKPIWSDEILKELERTLFKIKNNEDSQVIESAIKYLFRRMNEAFKDSCILLSEQPIVPNVGLPDENDEHVLRLAVVTESEAILTENIKDFPIGKIPKEIDILTPKEFLLNQLDLEPELFIETVIRMCERNKKVGNNKTVKEIIEILEYKHNCIGLLEEIKSYNTQYDYLFH